MGETMTDREIRLDLIIQTLKSINHAVRDGAERSRTASSIQRLIDSTEAHLTATPEPHIYEEHELWDDYIDVRFIEIAETVAEEATETESSKELTRLCDHYRKYQKRQKRYAALVSVSRDKRTVEQLGELKALVVELREEQGANPPSPSENPIAQELKSTDQYARDCVSDQVWEAVYKLRATQDKYEDSHKENAQCPFIAAAITQLEWPYRED